MLKHLIPLINSIQHQIYVEVFGGSGCVLFAKKPSNTEIYNDINSGLYDFMTVLSDPKLFKQFTRRVQPLCISRELYQECLKWEEEPDKVKRVSMWFVMIRQAFSGIVNSSWSTDIGHGGRSMSMLCCKWINGIEYLPQAHRRIQRVQIEHTDWRHMLRLYDAPNVLFYLDPPYIHSTRKGGKEYEHEMTDEDHKELVETLLQSNSAVILSGYKNEIYMPLEDAGWITRQYPTYAYSMAKTRASRLKGAGSLKRLKKAKRIECIWVKPCKTREGLFSGDMK